MHKHNHPTIQKWIDQNKTWSNGMTRQDQLRITPQIVNSIYQAIVEGTRQGKSKDQISTDILYGANRNLHDKLTAFSVSARPIDKSLKLLKRAGLIKWTKELGWRTV